MNAATPSSKPQHTPEDTSRFLNNTAFPQVLEAMQGTRIARQGRETLVAGARTPTETTFTRRTDGTTQASPHFASTHLLHPRRTTTPDPLNQAKDTLLQRAAARLEQLPEGSPMTDPTTTGEPGTAIQALETQLERETRNTPGSPEGQQALRHNLGLLQALLREFVRTNPHRDREALAQATDILDYARHFAQCELPINHPCWQDLYHASTTWHRRFQDDLKDQWADILQRRGNRYLAWNSPLDPLHLGEYLVVPLTDELALHQEGQAMIHCVGTYGGQCAGGGSRILSVQVQDNRVATGEIRLDGDTWRNAQTKGPHNRDVEADLNQLMDEYAMRYTRAWRDHPEDNPHGAWTTPA